MSDFNSPHCVQCKSPLIRGLRGPAPKYCSDKCWYAMHRKRPKRQLCCALCGSPCQGDGHTLYCSTSCARKAGRQRRAVDADCLICGNAYRKEPGNTGACSLSCGQRLAQLRKEQRAPMGTCLCCGETFKARSPAGSLFCSLRCRRRHDTADRKRRLKAADVGDRFTVATIAARDGTRCQICGSFVDMAARWPDPLCASIDHVVPLTRGGANAFSNVQLAHFACNARKGNRVEEVTSGT